MWIFLIVSTLAWGIAEIFYKKGNLENEKYSHLKTTIFVGLFFGIYATIIAISNNLFSAIFNNFLIYLPVAICYILSMTLSYFGVRFIEESISDPIENTSCAIVPILCAIFLNENFSTLSIIAIIVIGIGVACVGFFDKQGKEDRHKRLGKKLAVVAIAMPFCYMILDAAGTFLDILYVDDVTTTLLVNVTEETIEHTANCIYEYTFFLVAIGLLIFIKIKGEKFFTSSDENKSQNGTVLGKILTQKWKILAAVFETIGQATYLFALSEGSGIAAVILGAGTVIVSLVLSRVFLKEKLSIIQYVFILIILSGIIMLSIA